MFILYNDSDCSLVQHRPPEAAAMEPLPAVSPEDPDVCPAVFGGVGSGERL